MATMTRFPSPPIHGASASPAAEQISAPSRPEITPLAKCSVPTLPQLPVSPIKCADEKGIADFGRILDKAILDAADAGSTLDTTNAAIARLLGWSDDAGGSRMCQIRKGNRAPPTADKLLRLPPDVLARVGAALIAHAHRVQEEAPVSLRSPVSHVLGITREVGELANHMDEALADGVIDEREKRIALKFLDRVGAVVTSFRGVLRKAG